MMKKFQICYIKETIKSKWSCLWWCFQRWTRRKGFRLFSSAPMGASTKLFDTSASASRDNSNHTRTPKSRAFMSQDTIRFPSCPSLSLFLKALPIFLKNQWYLKQSRLFKIKPASSISHETALVQVKLIPYKKFLKISKTNLDDISGFWSRSG